MANEDDTGHEVVKGLDRSQRGPAPVHLWNPPYCGDLDITIRADGSWWHEGGEIRRPEMVRLFAGILKREDGRHFLVTPVEKVGITVEDAPLLAVDVDLGPDGARFTTATGDVVLAGPDHPVIVRTGSDGSPRPYVHIRSDLWALIDRKSFYRLAEAAEVVSDEAGRPGDVQASVQAGGYVISLTGDGGSGLPSLSNVSCA